MDSLHCLYCCLRSLNGFERPALRCLRSLEACTALNEWPGGLHCAAGVLRCEDGVLVWDINWLWVD